MEAKEILMATFPTETGADDAVAELESMAKAGTIEIIEAAVIRRNAEGETSVSQVNLPTAKKWAGKGALIGGIVGLIFPPSIIGGALVGAGIGGGTGALAKHALSNPELEQAAAELEPGSSSFMAVVDQKWAKQLAKAMEGYNRLAEHALDADTAARLELISDDAAGVAAMSGTVLAQNDEAAMISKVEVVGDMTSGVVEAQGATVYAEDDEVAVETFEAVGMLDEVPDALGGYEASLEQGEEE